MKRFFWAFVVLGLLLHGCDSGTNGCDGGTVEPGESSVIISETSIYTQIEPSGVNPTSAILFYTGAQIEPSGYIDPLQRIAEKGYRVLVIKSMLNLPIMSVGRASQIMRQFDDIDNWIIGGHSLGGVAAVKAILQDPGDYRGLILMASYPDTGDDLTQWKGAALSISAENDGLTTADEIEASKALLPQAMVVEELADFPVAETTGKTIFYDIKGGNHAQFGNYGNQDNDGQATISAEIQHELIIDTITRFLSANKW